MHFKLLNKGDFGNSLWIPVPLHKKKLRWRGFNQSAEIARELSFTLGGQLHEDALEKIKETPDQVTLQQDERKENLLGAFQLKNPAFVRGKKILLVDDVFTTGATMEECAKVLKQAGAREVWGVAIARG
jgi:ComF family protein